MGRCLGPSTWAWLLGRQCWTLPCSVSSLRPLHLSYLRDHPGTMFFSIFMSFWAMAFLELWNCKSGPSAHTETAVTFRTAVMPNSLVPQLCFPEFPEAPGMLGRAETYESNMPGSKSSGFPHVSWVTLLPSPDVRMMLNIGSLCLKEKPCFEQGNRGEASARLPIQPPTCPSKYLVIDPASVCFFPSPLPPHTLCPVLASILSHLDPCSSLPTGLPAPMCAPLNPFSAARATLEIETTSCIILLKSHPVGCHGIHRKPFKPLTEACRAV